MAQRSFRRRSFLGALALAPLLPAGACTQTSLSDMFRPQKTYTLTPRGDRMVRWLQNSGKEVMMAPEAPALMGITNEGRDIPVKQLAENGSDGRYVISLTNMRKIHDLILHRKQGETLLILHLCDTKFTRLVSVRYPRNGKPSVITDTAMAEADFQEQLTFWFDRMPGR